MLKVIATYVSCSDYLLLTRSSSVLIILSVLGLYGAGIKVSYMHVHLARGHLASIGQLVAEEAQRPAI